MFNFSFGEKTHIFVSYLFNMMIHSPFPSVPKEAQHHLENAAVNLPGS